MNNIKKLATVLILLITTCSVYSQSDSIKSYQDKYKFEIQSNGIVFNDTIDIPNTAKDDLFNRTIEILYGYYSNPKKAIQMENKETSVVMTSSECITFVEFPNIITAPYTLKIKAEDNKLIMKMKVSNYENDSSLCGFILNNYPFEERNENNKNYRVPNQCFIGLCKEVTCAFKVIGSRVSENTF